jgi:uncharacterized protein
MEGKKRDPIEYLRGRREELRSQYGIQSIRVFGSRARGSHRTESDIDILITAQHPYRFDLIGMIGLEQEISDDLGIPVDLIIEEDLKPSVATSALSEAVSI